MRISRTLAIGGGIAVALLLALSSVAVAQAAPAGATEPGPLVLSPIRSNLVFSPEVKVTTVNDVTSTVVGGYVGKLIEKTALIGVGAYGLVDPRSNSRLYYGGLVLGWRLAGSDRINVSARGLVGLGRATLFENFAVPLLRRPSRPGDRDGSTDLRLGFQDDFLIAEPEAQLHLGLTNAINLNVGVGYRATSARDGFSEPLRGPTGTIAVQFSK